MAQDIPTTSESGIQGIETTAWNGLFAPAGTPQNIIQILQKALNFALSSKEVHDLFSATGSLTGGKTPEQFTDFVKAEKAKWLNVVKSSNIKLQP
jgi:tripartite-type tricarboxylate transporter receptor subunit TctC